MFAQAWLQIILTLLAIFLVSIPLGRYMARIVMGRPTKLDRIFDPIDNAIYFLIGRRDTAQAMKAFLRRCFRSGGGLHACFDGLGMREIDEKPSP